MSKRRYVGCAAWVFEDGTWRRGEDGGRSRIRSHRDLDVFNLAYTLAMEVFELTARLPGAERYALVDQIRRSSRGVCGNIVEGFAKRRYAKVFKNALNDSLGESEETNLWLDFALDCEYVSAADHERLAKGYGQVSAMLWTLMNRWESSK